MPMTIAELKKKAAADAIPGFNDFDLLSENDDFIALVDAQIAYKRAEKAVADGAKDAKARNKDIEDYLTSAGATKVQLWDGLVAQIGKGRGASRIDPAKLLELGVPMDTILAATVEGEEYTYSQIVFPK